MRLFLPFAALLAFNLSAFSGESALTTTFQPLCGLGSGKITVVPVTCHDWYSHGSATTAIGLISARNVPPTNNTKEATDDVNLASTYGVRLYASDIDNPKTPLALTLDTTRLAIPRGYDYPKADVVRACLECLRRCLPEKLKQTPVTLKSSDADKVWLTEIVTEFNAHNQDDVFYQRPE